MQLERMRQVIDTLGVISSGSLVAGEQIKAECGEDEIDERVPPGKVWRYRLNISITEEDA